MASKSKVESIEEYLARGGKVTVYPTEPREKTYTKSVPAVTGINSIMTLGEAELFYGEIKPPKEKKQKPAPNINIEALPEVLRNKLKAKLSRKSSDGEE